MPLTVVSAREDGPHGAPVQRRVTLGRNEVFRLPPSCRGVRVVSGRAWVSVTGRDIVLRGGEAAALAPQKHAALVSSLGRIPLVLEYYGADDLCVSWMRWSCWKRWLARFATRRKRAGNVCA